MSTWLRTFLLSTFCVMFFVGVFADAQNRTVFGGIRVAWDYAYGANPRVAPLNIVVGNTATGAQTVTLSFGRVTLPDGISFMPLAVNAPATVGVGANAEMVTPSAVSCTTPDIYATCQFTATFANTHGLGDLVTSGTEGLQEAANQAHILGGLVLIDGAWKAAGGVAATLTNNKGWTNVKVIDGRGTTSGSAFSYKDTSGDNTAWVATSVSWY